MGAGDDPEAAVLDVASSMAIQAPHERAVARGDVDLVLVPRLPLEARRLDEQHRLHALDAAVPVRQVRRRRSGSERRRSSGGGRTARITGLTIVRLVDAEDAAQHLVIAHLRRQRLEAGARIPAAGEVHGIAPQLLDLCLVTRSGTARYPFSTKKRTCSSERGFGTSMRSGVVFVSVTVMANWLLHLKNDGDKFGAAACHSFSFCRSGNPAFQSGSSSTCFTTVSTSPRR